MAEEILEEMNKRIINSFLDMLILIKLRKEPLSDYDILNFANSNFNVLLNSDTLHQSMSLLERDGLIKSEETQTKKIYSLTKPGEEKATEFIESKGKILGLLLNLFAS